MSFEVRFAAAAEDDLNRLFEFLLARAETMDDLDWAQRAIDAIRSATLQHLTSTPYGFRKNGQKPDALGTDHPLRRHRLCRPLRNRDCCQRRGAGGTAPA
jgi:plasmid stabilization system protein ParE